MPTTCTEIEELVIQACKDLQTQENPKIAITVHKYNISKDHVYRRWNGLSCSRIDTEGVNKVLNDITEQVLCLYIEFADDLNIFIREKTLIKMTNFILRNRYIDDDPPRIVSDK